MKHVWQVDISLSEFAHTFDVDDLTVVMYRLMWGVRTIAIRVLGVQSPDPQHEAKCRIRTPSHVALRAPVYITVWITVPLLTVCIWDRRSLDYAGCRLPTTTPFRRRRSTSASSTVLRPKRRCERPAGFAIRSFWSPWTTQSANNGFIFNDDTMERTCRLR